jgi:hypothetical protein
MQTGDRKTNHAPRILALITLLICVPLSARADAGTPLMWAGMLHLVFGNAIIGFFEGFILAKVFKLKTAACILTMIPANYFSAWLGGLFLNQEIINHLPFNLYNAWRWIWVMVVVTYLMTLVLEWPFVFFCFRKDPNRLKRSWRGNLLVNSLSYVVLFGWYWSASGTTLYTKAKIVQPSEINSLKSGFVYYIFETNTVCRFDFDSHQMESICKAGATDKDDRLFVKPSVFEANSWNIFESSATNLICSNLQVVAVSSWRDGSNPDRIEGTWFNFGDAAKLADQSDWNFETGFWPIEGFHGKNQKTGEIIHFSLETPFIAWNARNATHLPGDFVVFQLGEDQICLFEAATKKMALLTKGRGPVVVLPR